MKRPAHQVRVFIVEDSLVVQRLLRHVIDSDPRLRVVGCAADADEAMRGIARCRPDVVTMDIRLPRQNGFEATRRIMEEHPMPIVVVAANVDDKALDISMNALKAGALAVVEKPAGTSNADYAKLAGHLCTQLYIMSQVRVVRQRRTPRPPAPPPPDACRPERPEALAIAASTGGPGALAQLLGRLPAGFPLPVLLVQHIGSTFVSGFASWLGSQSALPVALAADGEVPPPGAVRVAPGGGHMRLAGGRLRIEPGVLVQGQMPSGDVLLESVALECGARAVGIVLTGMGEDGARGLLAMRQAGAYTIAESEASAVIWGMPGSAVALGAAMEQLPIEAIPGRLSQLVQSCRPEDRP